MMSRTERNSALVLHAGITNSWWWSKHNLRRDKKVGRTAVCEGRGSSHGGYLSKGGGKGLGWLRKRSAMVGRLGKARSRWCLRERVREREKREKGEGRDKIEYKKNEILGFETRLYSVFEKFQNFTVLTFLSCNLLKSSSSL